MKKLLLFFLSLCCFNLAATAQIIVTGTVTSATDELSLPGVNVIVKGTTTGTITDFDGNYQITVPSTDAVLLFSFIGYNNEESMVGSQTVINISLGEDIQLINEVVVIGYGTQKRSNISGAVSVVTAEEITETPILRAEQALQGRTAGVSVAQVSGSPGSPLTVRVRGTGTINNSDPLYLVDGVPVDGIDFLNANDIESMSVLKDGASAAIYGTRAANGVVLITTKGGKKNQEGKLSYDAYYGIQKPWKKMNLLNAREYAIISNEGRINAGQVPLPEFANPDALGEGTDWQEAIIEDAPIESHQIGFSGGSEKSAYNLSVGYFSQDGIIGGEKANFERYTARVNTTHDIKKWLKVGNTLSFTYLERGLLAENNEFNSPLIRALNMDPVTPVRKADGTYAYSVYSDTDITNPVNAMEQTYDTWTTNRLVGALYAEATLLKGLTIRTTYSVDANFSLRDIFRPRFDLSNNPILGDAPAGEKNLVNSISKEDNTWKKWQLETVMNYNTTIGEAHKLNLTLGNTRLVERHDYGGKSNTNLPSNDPDDAFLSNTIDPIESQGAYAGAEEGALLSYFGRVNYEYDDRYLFTATLRADGSSNFGPNNRYGYFPSFSLGWIASNEEFWNQDGIINFFKVRTSWGQNGNDRIGRFAYLSVVSTGQNYSFDGFDGINNGSLPIKASNPDIQWETSTQTNIGLDVGMFNNRLNLTADYYIKNTSDMLAAPPLPEIVGADAPFRNVGEVENKGLELSLEYKNKLGGLKYSVSGNIAFISTEVVSLGNDAEPITSGNVQSAGSVTRTEVGHPIASFYGYVTDGLFQNVEEISTHAFQNENTAPGDIRYKDLNGDNVINDDDRTFIGNPTPEFNYGANFDASFKGFDISIFLQGTQGNDIYNATTRYDFVYTNRPQSILNRWTGPGTSNFEPRVTVSDPNYNARASDRFVEDGSYLRLKNLQVGYSLPKSITDKLKISKFRFYVAGQNLFTFTDYSGLDPEIGIKFDTPLEIGIDRGFYPQSRTILGGVNVVF